MGFGQSKLDEEYPIEVMREPGYKHDYDEEMDEEKKLVVWRITYGKPDWCGRRKHMTHEIEDGPETEEEFKEWAEFPIPRKTRDALLGAMKDE